MDLQLGRGVPTGARPLGPSSNISVRGASEPVPVVEQDDNPRILRHPDLTTPSLSWWSSRGRRCLSFQTPWELCRNTPVPRARRDSLSDDTTRVGKLFDPCVLRTWALCR